MTVRNHKCPTAIAQLRHPENWNFSPTLSSLVLFP